MSLGGRIALVTGASRGIGAAIAERLALEGAQVIATARTQGGLEALDDRIRSAGGKGATLCPLDLTAPDDIERMAAGIAERFGRLDILVGNAGALGVLTPVPHLDSKVWAETLAVNATANWRLIRAFDVPLRAAPAGRAVFVTSGAARGIAYWGAYAASKAALEALVRCYAGETATTSLRVNILDPGAVRTRMRAAAFPGEDPMTLKPPDAVADAVLPLVDAACTRHGEVVRVG